MTVCVAAIASNGMIFGASDRMLSNAEIAFEPQSRKAWEFTSAIHALWSGDASVLAEVLNLVQADVQEIVNRPDADWISVSDLIDRYVARWGYVRRKRAEADLLAPLGLTLNSFIDRHQSLESSVADRITNALVGYSIPYTSCIVVGIDRAGSHIWVIENGSARCEDAAGFAAIGAGARHANSQMMLGQHSRARSASETLVLVHLAKKRAEVSPSVGPATDISLLGPGMGQHAQLWPDHLVQLDQAYRRLQKAERSALGRAQARFNSYLDGMSKEQRVAPQGEVSDGQSK